MTGNQMWLLHRKCY